MKLTPKQRGYWLLEECLASAKKYKTQADWKRGNPQAFSAAYAKRNLGWLAACIKHMESGRPIAKEWTIEECQERAQPFTKRSEFKTKDFSAYDAARKASWLDTVCAHMKGGIKPNCYWTKERCQEVAKQFERRSHFKAKYPGAYDAARLHGWLDELFPTK